ncbi:MAG: amidase signature domain-containing protein [Monoraphidium minutum]|nr:MAG: amidase signature domain-containing protein [Monoraphidium minutum]
MARLLGLAGLVRADAGEEVQILTPAEGWSEKEVEQAPYDLQKLAGPLLTGASLIMFRLLCESSLFNMLLYVVYSNKNCLPKTLTGSLIPEAPKPTGVPELPSGPEPGAAPVPDAASPASRVRAALASLGITPPAAAPRGVRQLRSGGAGGAAAAAFAARRPSIMEYHHAYLSGEVTPSEVVDAVIRFVEREEGAANWLCDFRPAHLRAQAEASSARFAAGAPLSVLDGVPYATKDCVDTYAHTSGSGTAFLGDMRGPVPDVLSEAPCVAALRSLGALCVGKTQMQEFGLLPTGLSAKLGLARNPHNPACIPGGSSGGSACVVAAGVCAFAIGTDGGGSVRIPAALCGVVGFKPTQGRMASEAEGSSLVTLGPLTTSVADALIVYAAMACPNGCFRSPLATSAHQRSLGLAAAAPSPAAGATTAAGAAAEVAAAAAAAAGAAAARPPAEALGEHVAARPPLALPARALPEGVPVHGGAGAELLRLRPLEGVRVGVFKQWFEDADPRVVAACTCAADLLQRLGATLVDITIPELDMIRVAHLVLFLSECYAVNKKVAMTPALRTQLHEDSRVILSVASKFTGADYLQALRVRRRASVHWRRVFEACDFVITPTTACVAPPIPPGSEHVGMLDLTQTSKLVRFTQPANVLGFPALTLPVGRDHGAPPPPSRPASAPGSRAPSRGGSRPASACGGRPSGGGAGAVAPEHEMPVGLQVLAAPWRDASLLALGVVLEEALRSEGVEAPLPPVVVNPLADAAARAARAAAGLPASPCAAPASPRGGRGRRRSSAAGRR